jgi:hypothetical protein
MMRKTLDFEDIKHKMTDIKPLYVNHLLAGRCIIPSQGSLASIALKSLIKKISLQAVEERVSFFAVAERVCIHDSH